MKKSRQAKSTFDSYRKTLFFDFGYYSKRMLQYYGAWQFDDHDFQENSPKFTLLKLINNAITYKTLI